MTEATEKILMAAIAADNTIDAKDAKAAMDILKGSSPYNVLMEGDGDRIISRKQAAALLGKCPGSVDIYGRKGIIRRIHLPIGKGKIIRRCQGYSRQSVLNAIKNGMIDGIRSEVRSVDHV